MRKLALGLVVAAVVFAVAAPAHALDCEGFTLDDGCLFTITGGDTSNPIDGYAVTNAAGVPMWDFVRDREAQAIGYPISQRWTNGPFTLQAFQKVILQWDPGKQRMNYYNTLDALANRYPHVQLPFVPPHQVLEADRVRPSAPSSGTTWRCSTRTRQSRSASSASPIGSTSTGCRSAMRNAKSPVTPRACSCCGPSARSSWSGTCRLPASPSAGSTCRTCPTSSRSSPT